MPVISQEEFAARFEVLEKLGEGGFGIVFKGYDRETKTEVAIKFQYTQGDLKYAIREFYIARRIISPFTVEYTDAFILHPPIAIGSKMMDFVLIMELLPGQDLWDYIHEVIPSMSLAERLDAFMQIAHDLTYGLVDIHRHVFHQDIKPENIMMLNGTDAIYLDYGLSCIITGKKNFICNNRSVAGTRSYLSPDRARVALKEQDTSDLAKNDVYALGLTLLEVALGKMVNTCPQNTTDECYRFVANQFDISRSLHDVDFGDKATNLAVKDFLSHLLASTDSERYTAVQSKNAYKIMKDKIYTQ